MPSVVKVEGLILVSKTGDVVRVSVKDQDESGVIDLHHMPVEARIDAREAGFGHLRKRIIQHIAEETTLGLVEHKEAADVFRSSEWVMVLKPKEVMRALEQVKTSDSSVSFPTRVPARNSRMREQEEAAIIRWSRNHTATYSGTTPAPVVKGITELADRMLKISVLRGSREPDDSCCRRIDSVLLTIGGDAFSEVCFVRADRAPQQLLVRHCSTLAKALVAAGLAKNIYQGIDDVCHALEQRMLLHRSKVGMMRPIS